MKPKTKRKSKILNYTIGELDTNGKIKTISDRVAMDYGKVCYLTDSYALDKTTNVWKFNTMSESVLSLPSCIKRIALEKTGGSYNWEDQNKFLDLCQELRIHVDGIETNRTSCFRLDNKIKKTDPNDVRCIWMIAYMTNMQYVPITKKNPPVVNGFDKTKDLNILIRLSRQAEYLQEKAFLHEFPEFGYAAYYQCVIAANYVLDILHGKIKDFDNLLWGKPSIIRASLRRDLLRGSIKRAKENKNIYAVRKKHLRLIKKQTRQIFHLVQNTKGTSVSVNGTSRS